MEISKIKTRYTYIYIRKDDQHYRENLSEIKKAWLWKPLGKFTQYIG